MSDAEITGSRRRRRQLIDLNFAVTADPEGAMFLYCDRGEGCAWIRPLSSHSTLGTIERVALTHRHKPK